MHSNFYTFYTQYQRSLSGIAKYERSSNGFSLRSSNGFPVSLQPSTPTKPVMFAEWLAGVSPPDPQTINKHVHDMVEVRACVGDSVHVCVLERRLFEFAFHNSRFTRRIQQNKSYKKFTDLVKN